MPPILSKNCIVGGELDWYCLVCCVQLPAAEDAMVHIEAAAHQYNLIKLPYVEKYKDDFIRKVRGVYYCEVCNLTFPTAAKVGIHVTEETHVGGKTGFQLKRAGTAIVFNENTLITESAWNGFVDDTCVLCNIEFDDESTHKSQQNHILNLINSSVTIATDAANDIYRKIDGGYQCLTCNKVVAKAGITEHLNSEQHKCAFISYNQNQNNVNDVKNDDGEDKESKNGDTTADTKPCKADGKALYTSPIPMKDKAACSSDMSEVQILAKHHGLSVNKGTTFVYCSVCSANVTATLDRINEHVNGKKHKKNMASQSQAITENAKKIEKTHFQKFLEKKNIDIVFIGNTPYAVIKKFLIHQDSYFGICGVGNKIICQLCGMDLHPFKVLAHIKFHIEVIHNCHVISSLEDEFVRELKSDLYQCGFCAHVESDLDNMLEHLATDQHRRIKAQLAILFEVHIKNKAFF